MLHSSRQLGALAELLVGYRFLEAGRLIAWPIVPCAYDLIVDGGDRLYRVQVKQARETLRGSGHWWAHTQRRRGANQPDRPLGIDLVDYLCFVTTADACFVIPVEACVSPVDARWVNKRIQIGPASRYQVFLNRFAIGSGQSAELTPAIIREAHASTAVKWGHAQQLRRKLHRRLKTEEVLHLRTLPICWKKREWREGLLLASEVAHQFNISETTLRNIVRDGKRRDLD